MAVVPRDERADRDCRLQMAGFVLPTAPAPPRLLPELHSYQETGPGAQRFVSTAEKG